MPWKGLWSGKECKSVPFYRLVLRPLWFGKLINRLKFRHLSFGR